MRLVVDKITALSAAYEIQFTPEELNPQHGETVAATEGPFSEALTLGFRVSRIKQRVLLSGEFSASLKLECGRCLKSFTSDLVESFELALNLIFAQAADVQAELELDEDQINQVQVVEGMIDLRPILLEQVLVRLPLYPSCDENCAGLCPYCGIDLNQTRCTCEPIPFNNRFGKLKDIKLDPK